jgi:hypothetical protein
MEDLKEILKTFPGLNKNNCIQTSSRNRAYNCIAWAAGDATRYWCPGGWSGHGSSNEYWPPAVSDQDSISSFIDAFRHLGYDVTATNDDGLEEGIEKVAFYVTSGGLVMHAARQLSSGLWTSKLGEDIDISHPLYALEGQEYGKVAVLMRRPRIGPDPIPPGAVGLASSKERIARVNTLGQGIRRRRFKPT